MIDTHCHLSEYDIFRLPEILHHAKEQGVTQFISVSAAFDDWAKNQAIAEQYSQVIPAFGIHPLFMDNLPNHWKDMLSGSLKAFDQAIVGEIGLDFYHSPNPWQKQQQIDLFAQQLMWAENLKRPVSVHCVKAHNECISLIKKYHFTQGGFVHGFSGSLNMAMDWVNNGFVMGVGAVLLKQNSRLRYILSQLPKTAWVLESDAPFMLPENTPATVAKIAQTAAQLTQKSVAEIQKQTQQNTVRLLFRNEC